jgi:hypothetical protein
MSMQGRSPEGSPFRDSFCFDHALRGRNSVAWSLERFGSTVAGQFQGNGGIAMFASEPHYEVCNASIIQENSIA